MYGSPLNSSCCHHQHSAVPASGTPCVAAVSLFDPTAPIRLTQFVGGVCRQFDVAAPACAYPGKATMALSFNGTAIGFHRIASRFGVSSVAASMNVPIDTNEVIEIDATAGNVTVTIMPPVDPCAPNHAYFKRVDNSANVVTLAAGAGTIGGVASIALSQTTVFGAATGESAHIYWNGTRFEIV